MFYDNAFFAGCESLMEDDTVEAEAKVTITPEEQAEEVAEVEEQATEQAETTAEVEQGAQQTELALRKFDELDRMIKHVETFGVDKAFLSLCNHNNILNKSFGLGLPAVESFDEQPSPYSAVSQAAMEGLRDAVRKVWEFLKRMLARAADWLVRIVKLYDLRLMKHQRTLNSLTERKKDIDLSKEGSSDAKVIDAGKLGKYADAVQQVTRSAPEDDVDVKGQGDTREFNHAKINEKFPEFPKAEIEVKSIKNVDAYLNICKDSIEEARSNLKDVGTKRAEIAKLNAEIAKAERESKEDNKDNVAKDLKAKVQGLINTVKIFNRGMSSLISVAGHCNSIVAKVFADRGSKKDDNKEEKK